MYSKVLCRPPTAAVASPQVLWALLNSSRKRTVPTPFWPKSQWFNRKAWALTQPTSILQFRGWSALWITEIARRELQTPPSRRMARPKHFDAKQLHTFILKTGWNSFRADNNLIWTEALSASLPSAKTSKRASKASPATTREGSLVATSSRKHPMVWGQDTLLPSNILTSVSKISTHFKCGNNSRTVF